MAKLTDLAADTSDLLTFIEQFLAQLLHFSLRT
jgi:hypothetical protein